MHKLFATALLIALVLAAQGARASDDASAGYVAVRPSLVKVWAFDRSGRPTESGSGIVVDSNAQRSLVLTASHVVAGAASIRVDINRDQHDITAHVERTGPRDLTLLTIDRGGLHAARFAPRSHPVVEGNLVAVAGYVKNDELIGVVGQEPRVLFPGTVSSRPENGIYLELENLHIEEGLSGGPVFDPATGEILGIVTSRTSDQRGGFADSGALVVVPFLQANNVASPGTGGLRAVAEPQFAQRRYRYRRYRCSRYRSRPRRAPLRLRRRSCCRGPFRCCNQCSRLLRRAIPTAPSFRGKPVRRNPSASSSFARVAASR